MTIFVYEELNSNPEVGIFDFCLIFAQYLETRLS